MTTERNGWISTLAVSVEERRSLSTTCRCGQELDVCHGAHCPRCGSHVAAGTGAGRATPAVGRG
jgi:hypothetical protein